MKIIEKRMQIPWVNAKLISIINYRHLNACNTFAPPFEFAIQIEIISQFTWIPQKLATGNFDIVKLVFVVLFTNSKTLNAIYTFIFHRSDTLIWTKSIIYLLFLTLHIQLLSGIGNKYQHACLRWGFKNEFTEFEKGKWIAVFVILMFTCFTTFY